MKDKQPTKAMLTWHNKVLRNALDIACQTLNDYEKQYFSDDKIHLEYDPKEYIDKATVAIRQEEEEK